MRNRLGRLVGAVVMMVGAAAAVGVGTAGSSSADAVEGPASVTMNSEPGTFVTASTSYTFTEPQDDVFLTIEPDSRSIVVGVLGAGLDPTGYVLRFETPGPLAPGRYTHAMGLPTDTGRAGIELSGQHRACGDDEGEFTIHDVGAGRVWLTYVHRCEGGGPAVFGEIRIGMSDPGPLQVTARSVDWPAAHPGVAGAAAQVRVVNQGDAPAGLSTAAVLSGTADFAVLGNDCTSTLAPGAGCQVTVGFTPSRPGARRGSLRLTDSAGGVTDVALGGFGIPGRTSWDMASEAGDYVGDGKSYQYAPVEGAWIRGVLTPTRLRLSVDEPDSGDSWDADFAAPSGQTFTAGATYVGAVRSRSDPTLPGIDVSGNGRGCDSAGEFTVHELTQHVDGTVSGLRLSFEQHCSSTPESALTGEIALGANDPTAPAPDTTGPAPVTALIVDASGDADPVAWTDPTTADWADTVVTVTTEGRPGARTIYAGRGASALVTGLDPALDSSIQVRSRDTSGNLGAAVTVELPATTTSSPTATPTATPTPTASPTASATVPPPATTAPPRAAPTVTLTAGRTLERERRVFKVAVAPGTPGERVVLQRRVAGVWSTIDRTALGPRGRARLVAAVPDGRSLWRAKVRATDDHLAATSPRIRLRTG